VIDLCVLYGILVSRSGLAISFFLNCISLKEDNDLIYPKTLINLLKLGVKIVADSYKLNVLLAAGSVTGCRSILEAGQLAQ
jgi:hypothetical protein